MAKELPYWKFVVQEYIMGNISLERWELQGIFYSVCAFYWSRECDVSIPTLLKKYDKPADQNLINELFNLEILKADENYLSISFLNEQWSSKETQKMVNAINGKKGGRPKKQNQIEANFNQNKTDSVLDVVNNYENKPNGFIFENPNITNIEKSKEEYSKVKESKENSSLSSFEILPNDEERFSPDEQLAADFEITEIVKDICKYFNMGEEKFFYKEQREVLVFVNLLVFENSLEHFKNQWENYKAYKHLAGNPHTLFGFIGKRVPGKTEFENSKWNSANWAAMLEDFTRKTPGKPKQTVEEALKQATDSLNPYDPDAPAPSEYE